MGGRSAWWWPGPAGWAGRWAPWTSLEMLTGRPTVGHLWPRLEATTPIFVDVPEPNQAANQMLENLGFTVSFEVARMYTRPVRPHRLDQLFGITSFELG